MDVSEGKTEDISLGKPAELGHAIRESFLFDKHYINLNHGKIPSIIIDTINYLVVSSIYTWLNVHRVVWDIPIADSHSYASLSRPRRGLP
jgi:hypothetical protein